MTAFGYAYFVGSPHKGVAMTTSIIYTSPFLCAPPEENRNDGFRLYRSRFFGFVPPPKGITVTAFSYLYPRFCVPPHKGTAMTACHYIDPGFCGVLSPPKGIAMNERPRLQFGANELPVNE